MADSKGEFFARFLKELFQRRGEGFVLKGGAAMRALFGENRLTKDIDLDFTHPRRSAESLHNTIGRALKAAGRTPGLSDFRVSYPSKVEHTPRWKVNFEDADGRRQHVEVEVSLDAVRAVPGVPVQVRYATGALRHIAPFWVDVYDRPALIASKLAALLGRAVPAPRDVYDLDLLCAAEESVDNDLVEWALERAGVERVDAVALLRDRLDALGWDQYVSQLADALPESESVRIDRNEWSAMKTRVAERLEAFLS